MLIYATATDEEIWQVLCKYIHDKGVLFVNEWIWMTRYEHVGFSFVVSIFL